MHEVLVNRLGGLSLPRKSVVRLTDRLDMTLDVYRGRKTTMKLAFCFALIKILQVEKVRNLLCILLSVDHDTLLSNLSAVNLHTLQKNLCIDDGLP